MGDFNRTLINSYENVTDTTKCLTWYILLLYTIYDKPKPCTHDKATLISRIIFLPNHYSHLHFSNYKMFFSYISEHFLIFHITEHKSASII